MSTKAIFNNKDNTFYHDLKKEVDQYFATHHLKKSGNWQLYHKAIVLFAISIGIYLTLMLVSMPAWLALVLCALWGVSGACIGFNVMHDANHGSYSGNHRLNEFLGLSMNYLGASSYFWKQKHNIIHHTYTNIDGIDDDIAKSPIIRQCETQKWVPAHKVQHIYLLAVYGLSTLFWVFIMDFAKYFKRKIYTTEAWDLKPINHITFWATKIWYVVIFIAIPIKVWGVIPWLVGYMVLNVFMGWTLSIVFQLAHVVENTEFESIAVGESKNIDSAWAVFQLKTTANFAMKSKIVSWLVGGLNFQVEHHLFPKISHIHYPAISKIVQQKCKEYNLPYHYNTSLWDAVSSHFRFMKLLGQSQTVVKAAA